jgi:excisionase family DNA binding protein
VTARGMSFREVLALPVAITLDDANRALGVGRSNGYAMAKTGEYPIPVLRLGRAYRCKRSDLLAYLGISDPEAAPQRAEPKQPQLLAFKSDGDLRFKARPSLRIV